MASIKVPPKQLQIRDCKDPRQSLSLYMYMAHGMHRLGRPSRSMPHTKHNITGILKTDAHFHKTSFIRQLGAH